MELETILAIATLVIGGGGVTGFVVALLTIRYERRKAKGEAHSAEYEGMKVEQDTYQELIADLKEAWNDQKKYIGELKEDRSALREERNELRTYVKGLEEKIQDQDRKIARLGRQVEALQPLICSIVGCKDRKSDIIGLIGDNSFESHK
jgi:chromosome segregation ATPase